MGSLNITNVFLSSTLHSSNLQGRECISISQARKLDLEMLRPTHHPSASGSECLLVEKSKASSTQAVLSVFLCKFEMETRRVQAL